MFVHECVYSVREHTPRVRVWVCPCRDYESYFVNGTPHQVELLFPPHRLWSDAASVSGRNIGVKHTGAEAARYVQRTRTLLGFVPASSLFSIPSSHQTPSFRRSLNKRL